jgi:DNA-directed RNA polymerase subunit RPC12/RpoP
MGCEPEYLYDYIPCRIPCSNCNTSFVHTELVDNTYYNEDEDEYYEVTCCPHCGHEIEHTLQFEKLIN